MRVVVAATAAIAVLSAHPASGSWRRPATAPVPAALNSVRLAGAALASRLAAQPGWSDFTSRHSGWRAMWNEMTASPHHAFGPPISLPGFASDAAGVDGSVRAFIAGHPGVFGAPTLETASVQQVRGMWYVRYRQLASGLPVLFSDWVFRVGRDGGLFAFDADVHDVPVELGPPAVRFGIGAARGVATRDLPYVEGRDHVVDGGLAILPWEDGHRLVRVMTTEVESPRGRWLNFVDAESGELLAREDQVFQTVFGVSSGKVHPFSASKPPETRPMRDLRVSLGDRTRLTDAAGGFSFMTATGTDTVTAALAGLYCYVQNKGGPLAGFSRLATNPALVNVGWDDSNSDLAGRDVYYDINFAHTFVKQLDPTFNGLDYSIATYVNEDGTCNAFYVGGSLHFFRAGDGCPNTAHLADVVFHEYGHALNDALYRLGGAPLGLRNTACHEATADVFSAFILDDPVIGENFYGPGEPIRNLVNTARWPHDEEEDPHQTALILGGAYWDLRVSLGLEKARELAHYCKYGLPDQRANSGVAMNDFFFETLVADDDDFDLTNGTPDFGEICAAFNAHGIGTNFWLGMFHTSVADAPDAGSHEVQVFANYEGPFGELDPGLCRLRYQVNGGPWLSRALETTDQPTILRGVIDTPAEALVRYYLVIGDSFGGSITLPDGAPYTDSFEFLVGPVTTVFEQNMETRPPWTVGAPDDGAVTGIWDWGNPNSTYYKGYLQPEDDHSPYAGLRCWMTGNGFPTEAPGLNDVDGGKTTLTTTPFDATGGGLNAPMIEYYRWFTNRFIDGPGEDPWRVQISSDGGQTWTYVENTTEDAREWRRVIFFVHDYVTPTQTTLLRFIATDEGLGTIIEAAVDDLRLLGFPSALDVAPAPAAALRMATPFPNPLRSGQRARFDFTLPRAGPVRVAVMDLEGRELVRLADETRSAGPQTLEWDGRDASGRSLAPGVYFVSLATADSRLSRRVMILR